MCIRDRYFKNIFSCYRPTDDVLTVLENGSEICGDYFNDNGFNKPIVIKEKTGLGVKVPPSNFTIYDVEQKVGKYQVFLVCFALYD